MTQTQISFFCRQNQSVGIGQITGQRIRRQHKFAKEVLAGAGGIAGLIKLLGQFFHIFRGGEIPSNITHLQTGFRRERLGGTLAHQRKTAHRHRIQARSHRIRMPPFGI